MRPRVDFFQTFRPCAPALAASGKTAATFDACAGQAESGPLGHPFHIETRLTEQIPARATRGRETASVTVIPACAVDNRDRCKGYNLARRPPT
jgi:hypothetical protein